jgi:hypothetical protein
MRSWKRFSSQGVWYFLSFEWFSGIIGGNGWLGFWELYRYLGEF